MLLRITNTPRPYAWGSVSAIADLLGRQPTGAPEAELWLGSHPGSPARIVDGATESDLAEWAAARAPGGRLPFLLKVLAASAPLSLQVHPTAAQARDGFARENAAGIALDARERNYRDPYPKPELIVALSDTFRALCGFRPTSEARADLTSLDDARLDPLVSRLDSDDELPRVLRWLLERDEEVAGVVAALSEHATSAAGDERGLWLGTVRMLAEHYPGDPGIAISTLLHTLLLRPGEALYLPAGNIHAYLEGLGIELMAASDNVIRGGLTAKHVDVVELLAVIDATPGPAPLLIPTRPSPGVALYEPVGAGFRLALVSAVDSVRLPIDDVAVVLCIGGEVVVDGAPLRRGEAAVVVSDVLHAHGEGRLVVATGR